MADFDFFDQYRDKMRSLQASGQSAGEDWQALSQRLDATMPVANPVVRRHRWAAAALLLLLLASNLWWGFTTHQQNEAFGQLSAKVDDLYAAAAKPAACDEVASLREQLTALQIRLDEALAQRPNKTRFHTAPFAALAPPFSGVRQPSALRGAIFENDGTAASTAGAAQLTEGAATSTAVQPAEEAVAAPSGNSLENLPSLEPSPLKWSTRPPSLGIDFPIMPKPDEKPPVAKQIAVALSPKSFKAGLTAGMLLPLDEQLRHEAGYSAGLRADLGLSRRWSLSAEWSAATLHYKAIALNAPIGLDSLPLPPGQQFLEADVMNQRLLHYSLGLRHVFSPDKNWHPYVAGAWSGLVVMPFMVHYETISETSGSIGKGIYETTTRSALKNYLRLAAGVEMPLSKRLDLSLEGSYLRQWRGGEPPMVGVQMGLGYLF